MQSVQRIAGLQTSPRHIETEVLEQLSAGGAIFGVVAPCLDVGGIRFGRGQHQRVGVGACFAKAAGPWVVVAKARIVETFDELVQRQPAVFTITRWGRA